MTEHRAFLAGFVAVTLAAMAACGNNPLEGGHGSGGGSSTPSCSDAGACTDAFLFSAPVAIDSSEIPLVTTTFCHGAACSTSDALKMPYDVCVMHGSLDTGDPRYDATCGFIQYGSTVKIAFSVGLRPGEAKDGETFTMKAVRSDTGATVLDETRQATFTEIRPNGAGCDPVCKQANAR